MVIYLCICSFFLFSIFSLFAYYFLLLKINDTDLQGLLSVITEFWEMLDKTNATCEKLVDQKKDLEEIWNEEKEKRRQTEKVSGKERDLGA